MTNKPNTAQPGEHRHRFVQGTSPLAQRKVLCAVCGLPASNPAHQSQPLSGGSLERCSFSLTWSRAQCVLPSGHSGEHSATPSEGVSDVKIQEVLEYCEKPMLPGVFAERARTDLPAFAKELLRLRARVAELENYLECGMDVPKGSEQ